MNVSRIIPRYHPRASHHPRVQRPPSGEATQIRWLGTAAHVVSTQTTTVLLDPFLSRPSPRDTLFRPLRSTPDQWWHWLPSKVDAVCTGHSHYDHLLDAPIIAQRTGAKLFGSRTSANFARSHGLAEAQIVEVPPGGLRQRVGDIEIQFVPSLHGRIMAGRVPFPGEAARPPRLPARVHQYVMGGAFGVVLRTPTTTIYHNGSSDLVDAELDDIDADVLLVGLAGRQATRDYTARLTGLLAPSLLVPTHHDLFFAPLEEGVRLIPGVMLDGFLAEARRLCPRAPVVTPTYEDVLYVPDDPRDAVFAPYAPGGR